MEKEDTVKFQGMEPHTKKPLAQRLSRRTLFIVVLIFFIVGIPLGLYFYENYKASNIKQPWDVYPEFPAKDVFGQVGNETIYGADINFVIKDKLVKTNTPKTDAEALKKDAIEQVKTESAIIQGGLKDGIVTEQDLEGVFNSAEKDQEKRKQLIDKIVGVVAQSTPTADITIITVWYYNFFPPQIPPEEAKQYALDFITQLRRDILAERITMKEAGARIVANTKLAQIDASYKGNSYFEFKNQRLDKNLLLANVKIDAFIRSAANGSVSQVLDTAPAKLEEGIEGYYAVVRVDNKKNTANDNFSDWLQKQKTAIQ